MFNKLSTNQVGQYTSVPLDHRNHVSLRLSWFAVRSLPKELRICQYRVFDWSAARLSRGILSHHRSLYPQASPLQEPPHCEENQTARAQDIGPASQRESQKYGGHAGLSEHLPDKELKPGADEEQQAHSANHPSHPLEQTMSSSLAIHTITLCSCCGHGSCHPTSASCTVIVRWSPATA